MRHNQENLPLDYAKRFICNFREARKKVFDEKDRNENSWMAWVHRNSPYIMVTIFLSTISTAYTVKGFSEFISQELVTIIVLVLMLLNPVLISFVLIIMLIGSFILSWRESSSHNWWLFTKHLCEKYSVSDRTKLEAGVNSRLKSLRLYRGVMLSLITLATLFTNFGDALLPNLEESLMGTHFTNLAGGIGIASVDFFIGAFFGIAIIYLWKIEVPLQWTSQIKMCLDQEVTKTYYK